MCTSKWQLRAHKTVTVVWLAQKVSVARDHSDDYLADWWRQAELEGIWLWFRNQIVIATNSTPQRLYTKGNQAYMLAQSSLCYYIRALIIIKSNSSSDVYLVAGVVAHWARTALP